MDWLTDIVRHQGLFVGSIAVFLGGLALNLTPCVYPMLPVTLAFFSQQSKGSPRKSGWLAFCYLLGISVNYAILGFIVAKTGSLFGAWLQKPVVLLLVALIIVLLALSLFGLYEFRLPEFLLRRWNSASTGAWGAFGMGWVVGLVAAPCIGPFILSLLLVVGQMGNAVAGLFLFFMLGIGMGLPYFLLGLLVNRFSRLPKAGAWMVWYRKALGLILLGLALYFLRPLLPEKILWMAVAILLAAGGIYLGWLESSRHPALWFRWLRQGIGVVLVISALAIVRPHAPQRPTVRWIPYTEALLEQARQEQRPVLIDVYADWCLPCVEMDHVTFRHPEVVQALAEVLTMRLDATASISPEAERLLERYKIYGAPTVLLFDRSGKEQTRLRLLGFVQPQEFLERLEKIL
ncbi:MAG: thioredoxin family protein, partial [Candidatus Omnitrophica bacterium]|nr:thioredoxin family protein [Candidatus Omnitrophota bacterium]